jgi:hypothetical protein
MAHTNEITGYRVINRNNGHFVDSDGSRNWLTRYSDADPTPVPRGDALRRLAAFLDANPGENYGDYTIDAVYREQKPIEATATELGDLLLDLCQRHGLKLGLSRDQIERQIASELTLLGASID